MYIKNCPNCGVEIAFENVRSFRQSIRRNSVCNSCKGINISRKVKGVTKSETHKKKLSEAKIGGKLSEEHKIKIGNSGRGLKRSDESKLRYSLSKIGDKNPNYNSNIDDYQRYRKSVDNLTKQNKKELIYNWNGFDYYDNEYIFDNFSLNYNNPNYPVIDHKISVFEGYKTGLTEIEISNIENLCITKRIINGQKGIISEKIFKENII